MSNLKFVVILVVTFFLAACGAKTGTNSGGNKSSNAEEFSVSDAGGKTKNVEGFGGAT